MVHECDRISLARKARRRNPATAFVKHRSDGKFQAALASDSSHYSQLAVRGPIGSLYLRQKFPWRSTIERHTRPYPPFEVYVKALQEFFKGHEMTAGEWELALPNTEEMKKRFKNEGIEDILLVITYSGRTPEWPS